MKPGQAYTLSVYARSDDSSAKLRLAVWNRPMDWREKPDAQSEPISLGTGWQRFELTFNVASYFNWGAVDLLAGGEVDRKVWVDAVQLETDPRTTLFQTRYPVEVALNTDKPFSGMLHLMGEPLELTLSSYTEAEQSLSGNLKLCIETFEGKVVHTKQIACPKTPGHREDLRKSNPRAARQLKGVLVMVKTERCCQLFRSCATATAALEKQSTALPKNFRIYGAWIETNPEHRGSTWKEWELKVIRECDFKLGPGPKICVFFPGRERIYEADAKKLDLYFDPFKRSKGKTALLEGFL